MNDSTTMGEAIALSSPNGRMSKRTRKAAIKRLGDRLFGSMREETTVPAKQVEPPDMDGYAIGELVVARFTNNNRVVEFAGRIVGHTLNYWKIESLADGVNGWPAGKVFHVSTTHDRKHSGNNGILGTYLNNDVYEGE